MKYWTSLTLGLVMYGLLFASGTSEVVSIAAALALMGGVYLLIGWARGDPLPFSKDRPPGE